MSGSGVVPGCGGPKVDNSCSTVAVKIGQGLADMNIAPCIPKPQVNVSRSRTVIERSAGTVSPSGPSGWRSTRRSASSGNSRSTGSSRSSKPSSAIESTTAAVMGLVIDAIRNKVS